MLISWDANLVRCAVLWCAVHALQTRKAEAESAVVAAREAVESGACCAGREAPQLPAGVETVAAAEVCHTSPQNASAHAVH